MAWTDCCDDDTEAACTDAGSTRTLHKAMAVEQLTGALQSLLSGTTDRADMSRPATGPVRLHRDGRHLGITVRQRDVLRLMLQGLPNKMICRELGLAEGTVKVHVSAILRSLGVATRAQAVVAAHREGIRFEPTEPTGASVPGSARAF